MPNITSKTSNNISADPNPSPSPQRVLAGVDPREDSKETVWITNLNGGTHQVPENWVVEDGVGGILLRGNAGKARIATSEEVDDFLAVHGPGGSEDPRNQPEAVTSAPRAAPAPPPAKPAS